VDEQGNLGCTRIASNQSLLRSGPEPEILDVSGAPVAPQRFFDIGRIDAEDLRGFSQDRLVMSTDWEQHRACDGVTGSLRRATARGNGDTWVYRAHVAEVETPVTINGTKQVSEVWHWPEQDNEAHSHIVLPSGSKDSARRTIRKTLQLIFVVADKPAL